MSKQREELTPMEVYILWRAHCIVQGRFSDSVIKFAEYLNKQTKKDGD